MEYGVYIKLINQNKDGYFIYLYVDDLLVTWNNLKGVEELKGSLKEEFEMTDLGRLSYFLGLEFQYTKGDCNPTETAAEMNLKLGNCDEEAATDGTIFRLIVGSLRHLCHSRPEICYSVRVISIFMNNPKHSHMLAAKRILRYLKDTLNFGIVFPHHDEKIKPQLMAYSRHENDYEICVLSWRCPNLLVLSEIKGGGLVNL
ncbi:PREDICTED: uncharacterized protein LOC109356293 [Lupinus angustifolius]|uniref:uncharacterized protein LOC109356293 n=1 Tax=Lupinus angustifolius TaxID=3871 RepID=UPI00092E214F|nr:PREDICTED: uncharacterized protein LOC109356293 [Lupinus angustifolius]